MSEVSRARGKRRRDGPRDNVVLVESDVEHALTVTVKGRLLGQGLGGEARTLRLRRSTWSGMCET